MGLARCWREPVLRLGPGQLDAAGYGARRGVSAVRHHPRNEPVDSLASAGRAPAICAWLNTHDEQVDAESHTPQASTYRCGTHRDASGRWHTHRPDGTEIP
ncbi:hypothetical protein [Aquihabitans sp. McL0605]|uniref:hypothetical protein n=1 Tax=Aquihabitans sp. McL0605 TaxID=3415671 RepID=UPI003CEAEB5D